MSQQSIFGRIGQLARANIHDLLDQAEDPPAMLAQMVRDYTSVIADAESAMAQTIASLRMMENDAREEQAAAAEWGVNATAASRRADEMRDSGETAEADKFDNLARVALRRQLDSESDARILAASIAEQCDVVERLAGGLERMRQRLDELRHKRDEWAARAMPPRRRTPDRMQSVDILDPSSEISRFEQKIQREEARLLGYAELDASALDGQFESLGRAAEDVQVEARLSQLKAGVPTSGF